MGCSKPLIRGSPPRMRGKVYKITPPWFSIRITPAYAGKRRCPRFRPGKTRDHPRVCGEKFYVDEVLPGDTGSPPRMRGKVPSRRSSKTKPGITPAYAGKRACTTTAIIQPKDHPRVCGEKGRAGGAGSWSWSELRWLLTRFPVKVIDTV